METTSIPTFKSKLPGYLSYPLKASEISHYVASYAGKFPFEFNFFSWKAPKQKEKKLGPYVVCSMLFQSKSAYHVDSWELTVSPVFRRDRKTISDLFADGGFRRLQEWISAPRTPVWYSTPHRFEVQYLTELKELAYTEVR